MSMVHTVQVCRWTAATTIWTSWWTRLVRWSSGRPISRHSGHRSLTTPDRNCKCVYVMCNCHSAESVGLPVLINKGVTNKLCAWRHDMPPPAVIYPDPPGGYTPQFSCDTPTIWSSKGVCYGGCLCDRDGRVINNNKMPMHKIWSFYSQEYC